MTYIPKGYVWKQTLDLEKGCLSLSKKKLGDFFYWALKFDCIVGDVFCLNSNFDRSWVGVSLAIDESKISDFEEKSGFKLCNPPKIKLN